ncbi:sodium:solute symporter family protein, partial [Xanthovirga aplysinae]|uniref:sodium:solute symporter family protein n=1 Tax=Xanthovirga aplysinae TaxID=2529853 RepID=UPI0012BD052D
AGNWLWWNMLAGGMLTTFFFAKYWRKANVLTDIEFIEKRYSGKAATFLRGFRAIYLGLFINALIIGWVNVALGSLLEVFFNIPEDQTIYYIAVAMFLVVLYSSMSGLLGVAFTDVIQFVIAITGCIILAVLVINSPQIGGIDGLKAKLPAEAFSFFPRIGSSESVPVGTLALSVGSFLAFITIQWWASWYPGAEPGGGGYVAQRMMSAKDEKSAVNATLLFQIAHYCIRPWPWILVALAALVLYPDLSDDDKKLGYVMAMKDFLPAGLKGLLLVAFFGAYMSTISTQLNWGTSYLVNDVYKRFIQPRATEKKYILASRLGTLMLMLVALYATTQITNISQVWMFIMECGAGLGLVLILRWYWWRINAWSEITATIVPFLAYFLARYVFDWIFPNSFFFTVGFTTIAWILATFIARPTEKEKLKKFFIQIRPNGNWRPFQSNAERKESKRNIFNLLICWISAVVLAYSILFLLGSLIFKEWKEAGIYGGAFIIAFGFLRYFSQKVNIFGNDDQELEKDSASTKKAYA